jgi:hypothetical protein
MPRPFLLQLLLVSGGGVDVTECFKLSHDHEKLHAAAAAANQANREWSLSEAASEAREKRQKSRKTNCESDSRGKKKKKEKEKSKKRLDSITLRGRTADKMYSGHGIYM